MTRDELIDKLKKEFSPSDVVIFMDSQLYWCNIGIINSAPGFIEIWPDYDSPVNF